MKRMMLKQPNKTILHILKEKECTLRMLESKTGVLKDSSLWLSFSQIVADKTD